jgi:hypothetical protein
VVLARETSNGGSSLWRNQKGRDGQPTQTGPPIRKQRGKKQQHGKTLTTILIYHFAAYLAARCAALRLRLRLRASTSTNGETNLLSSLDPSSIPHVVRRAAHLETLSLPGWNLDGLVAPPPQDLSSYLAIVVRSRRLLFARTLHRTARGIRPSPWYRKRRTTH